MKVNVPAGARGVANHDWTPVILRGCRNEGRWLDPNPARAFSDYSMPVASSA